MEESNPELESFRQQWKAEVIAKAKAGDSREPPTPSAGSSQASRRPPAAPRIAETKASVDDGPFTQSYHDLDDSNSLEKPRNGESSTVDQEPQSALEHYEKAVERESQGSLGDSLDLYRKAFKVRRRMVS
jgi:F-box protein 9